MYNEEDYLQLSGIIDQTQASLRIYHLGHNYEKKIEQFGTKTSYDPEGVMIL